jgi:hypothetical protein
MDSGWVAPKWPKSLNGRAVPGTDLKMKTGVRPLFLSNAAVVLGVCTPLFVGRVVCNESGAEKAKEKFID